jgi:ABC-2 type transport system ATP-binding protein
VFVSSHLMSEMALTAEHLIVIGRGRLLADTSVSEFISQNSAGSVRVRTPQVEAMRDALGRAGVKVTEVDQFLQVDAMTTDQVGELAAANHITIHELFAQRSSLEEAFMEMTRDSVEYQAHYDYAPALDPAATVGGNK